MNLLIRNIVKKLIKKKLKISIAESCTGGLLSSSITKINGSSKIFNLGIVAYSNYSKTKILKIPQRKIIKYGAVSKKICFDMVKNVSKIGNSKIAVSVTGIAGPSGATKNKPIGLVYIGIKKGNKIIIKRYLFKNKGRSYIQRISVNECLNLILKSLK